MARSKTDPSRLAIGDQIKLWRESLGLSQNELVAKSDGDLTKGGVSRIETGDRYPTLTTLEFLATHLGCSFMVTPERTYIAELAVEAAKAKTEATKTATRKR